MKRNILFVCLLIMGVILVGCSSNAPTPIENNKEVTSDTEIQEAVNLEDEVIYDVVDAPTLCLMKFTNNSDIPVAVEVNFVFEKNGTKTDAGWGHLYCLAGGEIGYISMKKPTNENGLPIEGYTTEYTVTVSEHGIFDENASFKDNITVEDSQSGREVTITVRNNSEMNVDNFSVFIVYYSGDTPVWTDDYSYEIAANGESYYTFGEPHYYDVDITAIPFDRYEIFVNDAFNYN